MKEKLLRAGFQLGNDGKLFLETKRFELRAWEAPTSWRYSWHAKELNQGGAANLQNITQLAPYL